jgi:hypothetical protein
MINPVFNFLTRRQPAVEFISNLQMRRDLVDQATRLKLPQPDKIHFIPQDAVESLWLEMRSTVARAHLACDTSKMLVACALAAKAVDIPDVSGLLTVCSYSALSGAGMAMKEMKWVFETTMRPI